jgi:hypothetical protein
MQCSLEKKRERPSSVFIYTHHKKNRGIKAVVVSLLILFFTSTISELKFPNLYPSSSPSKLPSRNPPKREKEREKLVIKRKNKSG